MAAFTELDWRQLDTFAIIFGRGLATVERRNQTSVTSWLRENGYQTIRLDFSEGISPVVTQLGRLLSWESQFGYTLQGSSRNLAALHDGFDFEAPQDGGLVLEMVAFEKAFQEDKPWSNGFLSIVSEHSLRQLATARRFFAILLVEGDEAPIIGQSYEELTVPYPVPWR